MDHYITIATSLKCTLDVVMDAGATPPPWDELAEKYWFWRSTLKLIAPSAITTRLGKEFITSVLERTTKIGRKRSTSPTQVDRKKLAGYILNMLNRFLAMS